VQVRARSGPSDPARPLAGGEGGRLAHQYERMVTIRRFEETLLELFGQGKLAGTTHTYIGQEANAVGVVGHLDRTHDVIFSSHRCHGHYIAFTDDLYGLACEVMGKADGVCGGKGGSQHLCKGNFYSNGVQGSIVPVSTGIALAEKRRASGAVTTVFLGDGTLGQGTVYECLNMASLWSLPMLFVLENNEYAQSTPRRLAVAGAIAERARPFGVETAELTTTDVTEIDDEARQVVASVRETGRPFFLVLNTYRFSPHSKGDDNRDPAEIEERRRSDPLLVASARLAEAERRAIDEACETRLRQTIEAAERAPLAAPVGSSGPST
jgi:TPP-dependent pyruvate/acetoin dehydrogenase alpha subunit